MPIPTPPPALMTAAELEQLDLPGKQAELIRGRLVVREPPGTSHGRIAGRLAYLLGAFVFPRRLGVVCGQDTGFKVHADPDTVRAPDVAFVSQTRADAIPSRGYAALAPDLLAEIVSPDDSRGEILARVADWLQAGTRLVWVIHPERREAQIFRPDGTVSIVGAHGVLAGEDVLPGFSVTLDEVLR